MEEVLSYLWYVGRELAAVAFTILIHAWKRNMMWSIAAGTLCYMLLIRI